MKIWNQAPLVRLIIPFIAGILAATALPVSPGWLLMISVPLLAFISAAVFVPKRALSYKHASWFGIILNTVLLLFGYQLTIYKTGKYDDTHFSKYTKIKTQVEARIVQAPVEKERSFKMVVEVFRVKQGESWTGTSGKAMLYLKKDPASYALRYGDGLLIDAAFTDIPPAQNPGQFDYRRFLAFHTIFQQASAGTGSWIATGKNSGNPLLAVSIRLRDRLLDVLKEQKIVDEEFAVGAALLLGYADKLDADIISAYSGTGALHVLSVSGLHVAIVYMVFNWLLFFLDKIKYGSILKAVILILLLWFYSALSGLSPSVLRAATMFSFIIIAKTFNRHTNIYNTLAASAFLLLIINPYLIMEAGFQLSYIAVIGIVYIQPKIYALFEFNSWLPDQAWTLTAVSIAAQIATFPLGLYYFHQFPNYFLISNFVVIPVSTVIMYAGIALFAFAKVPFLSGYLALCFNWSIWFLNASVKTIEKWPCALLDGISISGMELLLIYTLIVLFFFYFSKKDARYLRYACCTAILMLISQLYEQRQQFHQKKFIVYNIPKTSAIDFISAKTNVLFTDPAFAKNESGLQFNIRNNWYNLGINSPKIVAGNIRSSAHTIDNRMVCFHGKTILLVCGSSIKKTAPQGRAPVPLDYMIVSNDPKIRIADLLKCYHPRQLIFDSSNSFYRVNKWKTECMALRQQYYSVMDSGAFVEEL